MNCMFQRPALSGVLTMMNRRSRRFGSFMLVAQRVRMAVAFRRFARTQITEKSRIAALVGSGHTPKRISKPDLLRRTTWTRIVNGSNAEVANASDALQAIVWNDHAGRKWLISLGSVLGVHSATCTSSSGRVYQSELRCLSCASGWMRWPIRSRGTFLLRRLLPRHELIRSPVIVGQPFRSTNSITEVAAGTEINRWIVNSLLVSAIPGAAFALAATS